MPREHLESDESLRAFHPRDLGDLVGDYTRQVFVLANAHHTDEIEIPRNRIDLADLGEIRYRLSRLGDCVDVADREDDRGYQRFEPTRW